jgi:hypothetical protein
LQRFAVNPQVNKNKQKNKIRKFGGLRARVFFVVNDVRAYWFGLNRSIFIDL